MTEQNQETIKFGILTHGGISEVFDTREEAESEEIVIVGCFGIDTAVVEVCWSCEEDKVWCLVCKRCFDCCRFNGCEADH